MTSIDVTEEVTGSLTPLPDASTPTSTDPWVISPSPGRVHSYRTWAAQTGGPGALPVTSMQLLLMPPGWVLAAGYRNASLIEFEETHSYLVLTGASFAVAVVSFTLADLRALRDGQVWAVPTPTELYAKAMTRDEFRADAAATCRSDSPHPSTG